MNKYLRLLRFELKGLTRDPITLLLLAAPAKNQVEASGRASRMERV